MLRILSTCTVHVHVHVYLSVSLFSCYFRQGHSDWIFDAVWLTNDIILSGKDNVVQYV